MMAVRLEHMGAN